MKKIILFFTLILGTLLLHPSVSHAYFSVMDTGEILPAGKYQGMLGTQLITTTTSGANLVGRFDAGINEEWSFRAQVGFGTIDGHLGALVKWVPIPDYEDQPAIGFIFGTIYSKYSSLSVFNLRAGVLASKKLQTTPLIPYAAFMTGISNSSASTKVPMHLAMGTEFHPAKFYNISLWGEFGIGMVDAFNYVTVSASIPLDNFGRK